MRLSDSICTLGGDPWTLNNACQGVQIFGATGSGKTSGTGKALAKAYLRKGFGGLVLTVKPEDPADWLQYVLETGRVGDLIVIDPTQPHRFNFMQYEAERSGAGGGLTENLVNLFNRVMEVTSGRQSGGDPFWTNAARQLLRNTIDTLSLSGQPITLPNIKLLIDQAPRQREDLDASNTAHRELFWDCYSKLQAQLDQTLNDPGSCPELQLCLSYWETEFLDLGDRTRSSIVSTFTSVADPLLRSIFFQLFCTKTTVTPENSFEGKIILLNLPYKEFGEVGRLAQIIFKYLWQQAVERRPAGDEAQPVFLWADEAQYFVTSTDALFQQTARSRRACTVYLTQNLHNYLAGHERAAVESLLANLNTKVFHANAHTDTNKWAADLIGMVEQDRQSTNFGQDNASFSMTPQMQHLVPPIEFQFLKRGGDENELIVEAYMFKGGIPFKSTGSTVAKIAFQQDRL